MYRMYILVYWIRDESCGRRVGHQDKFRNPKGEDIRERFSWYLLFEKKVLAVQGKTIT